MRHVATLLLVLLPSAAVADGAAAPAPASAPVSPLVAASRAAKAKAAQGSAPTARKVWTIEDLEALEKGHQAPINVLAFPGSGAVGVESSTGAAETPGPGGVTERYREILTEADAEIAKLERERLAGTNPLLRGMAGEKVRPVSEIDADLAKWRERRDVASHYVGESK